MISSVGCSVSGGATDSRRETTNGAPEEREREGEKEEKEGGGGERGEERKGEEEGGRGRKERGEKKQKEKEESVDQLKKGNERFVRFEGTVSLAHPPLSATVVFVFVAPVLPRCVPLSLEL